MKKVKQNDRFLRSLPSITAVLDSEQARELTASHGRVAVVDAVRTVIAGFRTELLLAKAMAKPPDTTTVLAAAHRRLQLDSMPHLRRAINATGIILHTGLGRAVMPETAASALSTATGYCNLQLDMESGDRNSREHVIRDLVCRLTGAEDVAIVNNNAGATLLTLKALAEGKQVIVSRGELIEIGGSFRLPDIMEQSGARLREVGTTNKTHLKDYARALSRETGLLMKAHKSNYSIRGFTHEVGIADIAALGHKNKVPVVDDLGCGALVGLENFGLGHEITVRESLQAGVDIALFSTDKLIGGPQGGLIVGKASLVRKVLSHPLYRVLRVCKLTLSALEATLRLFLNPDSLPKTHPVYRSIAQTVSGMEQKATSLGQAISAAQPRWDVSVTSDKSYLGGGALPDSELPSFAVRLKAPGYTADALAASFRAAAIPVVPYVREDAVLLNLRTIEASEMPEIVSTCRAIQAPQA